MLKRLYNFLSGTRISSSQVNAEFDQLIGEANNNAQADSDRDTALRAIAQMYKLTADDGGVKISLSSTDDDILQEIVSRGKGFYTFYAAAGSKNLPLNGVNGSIRGIAHITSSGFGWMFGFDYKNNFYTNYLDSGVWRGWRSYNDTGWIGLTLQNGCTNGNTVAPQYAVVGNKVIFKGSITIGTYGQVSFTMPDVTPSVKPPNAVNPIAVNTTSGRNGGVRAYVSTGGAVTFFGTINNGDVIDITSMSYNLS